MIYNYIAILMDFRQKNKGLHSFPVPLESQTGKLNISILLFLCPCRFKFAITMDISIVCVAHLD